MVLEGARQRRALRRAEPAGPEHGTPVRELELDLLLLEGRCVEPVEAARRGHADHPELSRLHRLLELAGARDHDADLTLERGVDHLSGAEERRVGDAARVAADGSREQGREDVVDAADLSAGPRHLRRVGPHRGAKIGRGRDRRFGRHRDREILGRQPGDGSRIGERRPGLAAHERAEHRQSDDDDAVRLGAVFLDEAGKPGGAAPAGVVRDRDAAGRAAVEKRLLDRVRGLVPGAAGCGRHGDLEVDLGKRGRGENGARGGRQRVAPHQPNEGVTDDAPPATRLGPGPERADASVPGLRGRQHTKSFPGPHLTPLWIGRHGLDGTRLAPACPPFRLPSRPRAPAPWRCGMPPRSFSRRCRWSWRSPTARRRW